MAGRIIISGGTGLIGTKLAHRWLARGGAVDILTRQPEPKAPIAGARYTRWDGERLGDWSGLLDGAAAIVNLAGANIAGDGPFPSRWNSARKQILRESRLLAGGILARAAELATTPPPVFIQASAVGYYGTRQKGSLDESAAAGEDFLARLCQEWEASSAKVESLGIRRLIVRIGVVLSAEGGALPKMALPFRLFAGGPLGSGTQVLSWVHIDDVVAALCFLIDEGEATGIHNVCAPQPLSNRAFSQELARALHRPCWLPTPGFALRLAFGEAAAVLLEGQSVAPKRLLAAGFKPEYPDLRSALKQIYAG